MNVELGLLISRGCIRLFYAQNGVGFKPFEYDGANEVPLYFYSEGLNFEIGESAKSKFLKGSPDGFGDYFELIKNTDKTFSYLDEKTPFKQLLIKGVERVLDAFLKEILLSPDKSASLKDTLNINLVFSSDVKENEVLFVGELFQDDGYEMIRLLYYDYLLLNYFDLERKIGAYEGYILVGGIDGNLHLEFYASLSDKLPKLSSIGIGLANDPRDKIIAQILFDKAVLRTGAIYSKAKGEQEVKRLVETAKKHSSSDKALFYVPVQLSDGSSCKVRIKMNTVNDILSYQADYTKDFDLVVATEQKTAMQNVDLQVILKKSISSELFKERLRRRYNNVYQSEANELEVYNLFRSMPEIIAKGNFLHADKESSSPAGPPKGPPKPPSSEQPTGPPKSPPKPPTVPPKVTASPVSKPPKRVAAPPPPPPAPKVKKVGVKPSNPKPNLKTAAKSSEPIKWDSTGKRIVKTEAKSLKPSINTVSKPKGKKPPPPPPPPPRKK
jgi:hypothetical protein